MPMHLMQFHMDSLHPMCYNHNKNHLVRHCMDMHNMDNKKVCKNKDCKCQEIDNCKEGNNNYCLCHNTRNHMTPNDDNDLYFCCGDYKCFDYFIFLLQNSNLKEKDCGLVDEIMFLLFLFHKKILIMALALHLRLTLVLHLHLILLSILIL